MVVKSMGKAIGLLEVFGLACALKAADAGCKAGYVTIDSFDKNKPLNAHLLPVPLLVCIKFRGNIEDVRMAMEAAVREAEQITGVYQKHIIPQPDDGVEALLQINCLE